MDASGHTCPRRDAKSRRTGKEKATHPTASTFATLSGTASPLSRAAMTNQFHREHDVGLITIHWRQHLFAISPQRNISLSKKSTATSRSLMVWWCVSTEYQSREWLGAVKSRSQDCPEPSPLKSRQPTLHRDSASLLFASCSSPKH